MIVFLISCIIDLIMNIVQAIIAAAVTSLVGILKRANDDGDCTEYNDKCSCVVSIEDASRLKNSGFECKYLSCYSALGRSKRLRSTSFPGSS